MKINQNDANFLAGVEVGVRCHEKGMNLQAALEYAQKVVTTYPVTKCICRKDSKYIHKDCKALEHK